MRLLQRSLGHTHSRDSAIDTDLQVKFTLTPTCYLSRSVEDPMYRCCRHVCRLQSSVILLAGTVRLAFHLLIVSCLHPFIHFYCLLAQYYLLVTSNELHTVGPSQFTCMLHLASLFESLRPAFCSDAVRQPVPAFNCLDGFLYFQNLEFYANL